MTPELERADAPDILNQGVLMAVDQKGSRLLIATSTGPGSSAPEAAAGGITPDLTVDDVPQPT